MNEFCNQSIFLFQDFIQRHVFPVELDHSKVSMSKDTKEYSREVYNLLDFIGDLGGLFDGLYYLFSFVLGIFSFFGRNEMMAFVVSKLFFVNRSGKAGKNSIDDVRKVRKAFIPCCLLPSQ